MIWVMMFGFWNKCIITDLNTISQIRIKHVKQKMIQHPRLFNAGLHLKNT